MNWVQIVVVYFLRAVLSFLCNIDARQVAQVPANGPLILMVNHVNFLDVPMVVAWFYPRTVTALAKVETWKSPILGPFFSLWGAIPIRRGELDISAFRKAGEALQTGKILAIAPEGTRSKDGKLQKGYPGVLLLATKTQAPILPVVYYGGENFWQNLRKFKKTDFHFVVGKPFHLLLNGSNIDRDQRQAITDELMYQLAALLPEQYRGIYADLSKASTNYIQRL
ncbi:MAG TPA: lysophospholipid acyltransferase family protein [Anaerolineaceae bacterium]